jgi:hypothetical protein
MPKCGNDVAIGVGKIDEKITSQPVAIAKVMIPTLMPILHHGLHPFIPARA